ncbi:MAG: holo-[acyl-carrier-protein] synthase [Bacillus thermozeamaize]|uniref:Holo-[acyl-carrier-protein] synthase n=1 Tax=Bacillus thermozeamaize TaxID=230954 RepID=A0A1Y3PTJ3_9BACI|nr:MAG: holo-[acyl-carrier-protein] synthase [Bacillus thermozeamaize]
MILGTGIDLVDIRRIEAVLSRQGERFVRRILTPAERDTYQTYTGQRQLQYLAGRFAIKEAVAKAIGTGIGAWLGWQDLETSQEGGRPTVFLSEAAKRRLNGFLSAQKGTGGIGDDAPGMWERLSIHVSLSHERNYLVAQAVAEACSDV